MGEVVDRDNAGCGWQLVFAEGLGNVVVGAAAPQKPLVPSARPSRVLGLVLLMGSPPHACVLLGTGDVLLREDRLCLWPCFPGKLQALVPQEPRVGE